jgi:hypothetical protein
MPEFVLAAFGAGPNNFVVFTDNNGVRIEEDITTLIAQIGQSSQVMGQITI